jgi:hypothetical protein
VVSQQEWYAARAALTNRRTKAGRIAKHSVNVFANLLRDARDGGSMHQVDKGRKVIVSYRAIMGAGRFVSFPSDVFERAIFSCLREIDPRELLPQKDPSAEKVLSLSGRLQEVEGRLAQIKAKLVENPEADVDALVEVLRTLEGRRKALADQLAAARQEAASPAMEAWGQCHSLIDALDKAPDPADVRIRLRAAVRRIVDSIYVLTMTKGRDRLAAVQVWFAEKGKHRDYLILSRPALGGSVGTRPASWWARSLATVAKADALDLRKPDHARRLEKVLAEAEIANGRLQ